MESACCRTVLSVLTSLVPYCMLNLAVLAEKFELLLWAISIHSEFFRVLVALQLNFLLSQCDQFEDNLYFEHAVVIICKSVKK